MACHWLVVLVTGNESFADKFSDAEVTNDLNDAYTKMQSIGQTYAVVGNHDCSPVNSFPPAAVDTTMYVKHSAKRLLILGAHQLTKPSAGGIK